MSDTPLYPTPIGDQAPDPLTPEEVAECLLIASQLENWYIGVREILLKVKNGEEANLQQLRWVIDGAPALKVVSDNAIELRMAYIGELII